MNGVHRHCDSRKKVRGPRDEEKQRAHTFPGAGSQRQETRSPTCRQRAGVSSQELGAWRKDQCGAAGETTHKRKEERAERNQGHPCLPHSGLQPAEPTRRPPGEEP